MLSKLLVMASLLATQALLAATPANSEHLRMWTPPAGLQQQPLWPGAAPDLPDGSATPEVMFSVNKLPGFHYTGITEVSVPTMTVFKPAGRHSGAAIVVFPGGGFRLLAIDLEGTEICDWVTANGMTCVLVKYRVPRSNHYWDHEQRRHVTPAVPFALQDAQRAIRLVRARAAELDVDPARIGVFGMSAGGYLVAQTSNIAKASYRPVDAADQISSVPDFAIALYPGHLCRAGGSLDPSIGVSAQTPPTFLLAAWDDPVNKICNTTVYAQALASAGAKAEVHVYAAGRHAFGLRHQDLPIAAWPTLLLAWLNAIEILDTPEDAKAAGNGNSLSVPK